MSGFAMSDWSKWSTKERQEACRKLVDDALLLGELKKACDEVTRMTQIAYELADELLEVDTAHFRLVHRIWPEYEPRK